MSGLDAIDASVVAATVAVILFAIAYSLFRGGHGDPLERLATWARTQSLDYVAPESRTVLATFAGVVSGRRVEVAVTRVARSFASDVPPTNTTVRVGDPADHAACVLQPAGWVMGSDGRAAGAPTPSGDASFDAQWSARGDADDVRRLVTSALREQLLAQDADGLVIELFPRSVAIPMPGVCADTRELDRRLALALALVETLDPHPTA